MDIVNYGRKIFSLNKGTAVHTTTAITEKPLLNEGEKAFTRRLIEKYGHHQGTVEIIFRNGHPNYAVITFSECDQ